MNLYLIQRSPNRFVVDTFAFAIVAAETGRAARYIHPTKGVVWKDAMWVQGGREYGFDIWTNPSNVRSRLIGTAVEGTLAGMVCTAFQ
jgi:hypothetical protein